MLMKKAVATLILVGGMLSLSACYGNNSPTPKTNASDSSSTVTWGYGYPDAGGKPNHLTNNSSNQASGS